jgi:factor associated with neutral sphingomyelinase activation
MASQHLRPFIESALITSFDTSHLVDFHETFLFNQPLAVRKIKPLLAIPGALMLTSHRIYFQPAQLNNISDTTQALEYKKITYVYKRRHMLQSIGLEYICSDGSSLLHVFDDQADRDMIFDLIHQRLNAKHHISRKEMMNKWQRKEITNFEYLMYLNNEAGRSMNDLAQYPVSSTHYPVMYMRARS